MAEHERDEDRGPVAEDEQVGLPISSDPLIAAGVACFARTGTRATVRDIAAEAGVSAALLIKRFGSKDRLRSVCDQAVLERIVRIKETNIEAAAGHRPLMWDLGPEGDGEQSLLLGYVLHAVLEGGPAARSFVDHMTSDAQAYTEEAVASGVVRPSRDEAARAKYLVMSGIGALMVSLLLEDPLGTKDLAQLLRHARAEIAAPMMELFTVPFFGDDAILRDLAQQSTAGRHPATDEDEENDDPEEGS